MTESSSIRTYLVIGSGVIVFIVAGTWAYLTFLVPSASPSTNDPVVETQATTNDPIGVAQDYYSFFMVNADTPRVEVEAALRRHNISILRSFPHTRLSVNNSVTDKRSASTTDIYFVDWLPNKDPKFPQSMSQIEQETTAIGGEMTFVSGGAYTAADDAYAIGGRYVPLRRADQFGKTERLAILDTETKTLLDLTFNLGNHSSIYLLPNDGSFVVFDDTEQQIWVVKAATGAVIHTERLARASATGEQFFSAVYTLKRDGIVFAVSGGDYRDASQYYRMDFATHTIKSIGVTDIYTFPHQWRDDGRLYLASSAPRDCGFYPYLRYIDPRDWSIHLVDDTTRARYKRETEYVLAPNATAAVIGAAHTPAIGEMGMCGGDRTGVLVLQRPGQTSVTIEVAPREYGLRADGWTRDSRGLYYSRVYTDEDGAIVRSECVLYSPASGTRVPQEEQRCTDARYPSFRDDIERVVLWRTTTRSWDLSNHTLTQYFKTDLTLSSTTVEQTFIPGGVYPSYFYGDPVR